MSFSRSDIPHVKWSLLTFSLTLLLGISAIWVSAAFEDQAIHARQAAQTQLIDARAKRDAAQNDLDNMATYAKEYQSLEKRKVIGSEQRLDWIEDLERLRKTGHVIDFKYTVTPQQPYLAKPAIDSGNYDVKISSMNLQFDLLHEEQLLRFFAALRTDLNGWFIIDHCAIDRLPEGAAGAALKADCGGGWITIKNRNAP